MQGMPQSKEFNLNLLKIIYNKGGKNGKEILY